MKIVIADENKLTEKIINEKNKIVTFEYSEYLDFFTFEYRDNKILFKKNDLYHEILNNMNENLDEYSKLLVKSRIDNVIYSVFILPDYDKDFKKLYIKTNEIIIGANNLNISNILLKNINESFDKIVLKIEALDITLENTSNFKVYINNRISKQNNNKIKQGDSIFIDGVIFTIIAKNLFIYYGNGITYDKDCFREESIEEINLEDYAEIKYVNYNQDIPLNISPTIKKKITNKVVSIDPPSSVELKESNPIFLTMLPMVLMSSTSIIMSLNIISNIRQGKTTWQDNSISLIFSGVMIFTMILYPLIQNFYKKRRESKREIRRIEEYKDYIYEKKREIISYMEEQKSILINNYKDTRTYYELINNSIEQIWDKKNGDEDFLTISLGKGRIAPNVTVNYPEEHFTIDRDKLRIQIVRLKEQVEYINDCPIIVNLSKNNNISFEGKKSILHDYIKSFLVRLFASHSYNDLKVCVFTNSSNKFFWQQYSNLPYFWDKD